MAAGKRAAILAAAVFLMPATTGAKDRKIGNVGPASEAGTAQFGLTVGPNGRARECIVEKSSGDAQVDAAACRFLIKRGEWKRRKDEHGRSTEHNMSISLLPDFLKDLPR